MKPLPIENVIGSRRTGARDALGNFLGWGICFFGALVTADSYRVYRSGRFLSDLGLYGVGFGLYVAICGFCLAKRYTLGLWLAGAFVVAFIGLIVADLFDTSDYRWLPRALSVLVIASAIFGYFLWIRREFRSIRWRRR